MSTGRASYRLVADIGGTHARFALARESSHEFEDEHEFPTSDFTNIEDAIRHYLSLTKGKEPRQAALAIANPVTGDAIHMTNNTWAFSIAALQSALGLERLLVLNDFEALALSVPHLSATAFRQIGAGESVENAPIALIGPGTGLGMAGLIHAAGDWHPLVSEGGHVTAPAVNAREAEVIAHLAQRYPRVSAERLISGPGLVNLYQTLAALAGAAPEERTAKQISEQGQASSESLCGAALAMFCEMLGTLAGDLALVLAARGGVYLGGGIVPSMGDFLARSGFRERFEDKGRMQPLLAGIPTYIIEAPHAAFLGDVIALERRPA